MSEQIAFTFALAGTQKDEVFQVLTFTGDEGISRLYEFNIELLSDNPDADIDAILQQPATLTLTQGDDVRVIQGIVSHFDAVRQINNQVLYKARLVPRLWELSLYHTNEVYLEMTVPEIIEAVLTEGGFESVDYDLSDLQSDYKKWAYKCQYGETHLDFISRLMERDGIYYYFTRGEVGEKVVFCDQLTMQESLPNAVVQYSAASSLEINALPNTVHSFVSQQKRLPYRVMLKDYNDDKPSVDVKGEAIIDDSANKSSEIYVWGQNIETPEEGEQLAQIRAEQIRAGKKLFHGESSVNRLIPGYFFTLQGHFRGACNQDYCLLGLHHEGTDRRLIDGGNSSQALAYRNELSAQPADVQYRPALETPRPEIHGVLNAYVDSEGDGHYAEIDEEGRYRILLPFDRVDRDGGKASHWIRMSQPFAGENQGMHFPLRKGTEVLLTFVGGDPDRPVIAGSMPNAGAPSVINAENHTNSLIQTKAGNRIELEDKDGKNRIKFETPQNGTYMHLGAPNHAGDGWVVVTNGIERKTITGGQQLTYITTTGGLPTDPSLVTNLSVNSETNSTGSGYETTSTLDDNSALTADDVVARSDTLVFPKRNEDGSLVSSSTNTYSNNDELTGDLLIERKVGNRIFWANGTEFNYGEGNIFNFGNSQEITHWNQADSFEAKDLAEKMYGREIVGLQQYIWGSSGTASAPKCNPYPTTTEINEIKNAASATLTDDQARWRYMLSKGEVEIKQTDTFFAQDGNVYDFGGYWNYNFGNSYEENHLDGYAINKNPDGSSSPSNGEAAGTGAAIGAGIGMMMGGPVGAAALAAAGAGIGALVNECSTPRSDLTDTGGPGWNTINGEIVKFSNGGAWVTKSYGHSYDYTDGDTLEVVEGDAEFHFHGKSYNKYYGTMEDHFRGATHATYYGAASEIFLGASSDLRIGAASEMKIIGGNNVNMGVWTDINIGLAIKFSQGKEINLNAAIELRKKKLALKAEKVKLAKANAQLKKAKMNLVDMGTNIKSVKTAVEKAKAKVEKSNASVKKIGAEVKNIKISTWM